MSIVETTLPLPHVYFTHWDTNGNEFGVLIVKGNFRIVEGAKAIALDHQPELLVTDLFHGEANSSPLARESELAPFKPRTDISFNAIARSGEGKLLESWPVQFTIEATLTYGFHVFGRRYWQPVGKNGSRAWQASALQPVSSVPLTYTHAFGGCVKISDDEEHVHQYNPVGCGLLSAYLLEKGETVAIPQIGLLAELAMPKPERELIVCGCGPVAKSWLPRRALAGTLDDAWLKQRHPLMPTDFDSAFWNAAPLPLQAKHWLSGNEFMELKGLRHDPRPYRFGLPNGTLLAIVQRHDGGKSELLRMKLDTVHCEVDDIDCANHQMTLVWRLQLADPASIAAIEIKGWPADQPLPADASCMAVAQPKLDASAQQQVRETEEMQCAREALFKLRGWSAARIAEACAADPIWSQPDDGSAPFQRFRHPETGSSIIVASETGEAIHAGKPDYHYRSVSTDKDAVHARDLYERAGDGVPPIGQIGTIMLKLVQEGVDVWRPVEARRLDLNLYCIMPSQPKPADEKWEFNIAVYVKCQLQNFDDGIHLTAVRLHRDQIH